MGTGSVQTGPESLVSERRGKLQSLHCRDCAVSHREGDRKSYCITKLQEKGGFMSGQ